MDRRRYLVLCIGAALSGCLGSTGTSIKGITWLRLKNNRHNARNIEVFIERDDEEVFREIYHLGTTSEQASIRVDDPVEGPGRFSIYVDVGDQLAHLSPSEFTDTNLSDTCVGVRFTLHKNGTVGFDYEPIQEC